MSLSFFFFSLLCTTVTVAAFLNPDTALLRVTHTSSRSSSPSSSSSSSSSSAAATSILPFSITVRPNFHPFQTGLGLNTFFCLWVFLSGSKRGVISQLLFKIHQNTPHTHTHRHPTHHTLRWTQPALFYLLFFPSFSSFSFSSTPQRPNTTKTHYVQQQPSTPTASETG